MEEVKQQVEGESELMIPPTRISDAQMKLMLENDAMLAVHIAHCLDWSITVFKHKTHSKEITPQLKQMLNMSIQLMKLVKDEEIKKAKEKLGGLK